MHDDTPPPDDTATIPFEKVETLKEALLRLIGEAGTPDIQVEASRLISCIAEPRPDSRKIHEASAQQRRGLDKVDAALIETGIAALAAKSPNVPVAKYVRNKLEIKRRNQNHGLVPLLSRKLSDSAVYAMLVGVIVSALLWAIGFAVLMTVSTILKEQTGADFILPPVEAKPLAFAALVGGSVSVLTRVNDFADLYIFDPFLVFVNSLLKPLIGTVLALTAYAILETKIVTVEGLSFDYEASASGPRFIYWVFGFVAGFSERLAGDFIARAESVVGGASDKVEAPK